MKFLIKLKLTTLLISLNSLNAAGFDENLFDIDMDCLEMDRSSRSSSTTYNFYSTTALVGLPDSWGKIHTYARIAEPFYPEKHVIERFFKPVEALAIISIAGHPGKYQRYAYLKNEDSKKAPRVTISGRNYAYIEEVTDCVVQIRWEKDTTLVDPSMQYDIGDYTEHCKILADITRTDFSKEGLEGDGITRHHIKSATTKDELKTLIARPKYVRIGRPSAK